MNGLTRRIIDAFEPARDPAAAESMARYMRDQFEFLGSQLARSASPAADGARRLAPRSRVVARRRRFVVESARREYQYAACDLLVGGAKLLTSADLPTIARLITTKSWWDTVDALAISVVGPIVLTDRSTGDPVMDDWIHSDDMWLARTAILHQNKWKTATDEARLFAMCLERAAETDFFYRKAIGWALREYSKTAPDAVRAFIAAHDNELSGLSKREGTQAAGAGHVMRLAWGGTSERYTHRNRRHSPTW